MKLSVSVVARSNDILKQLVLEAKREYEKDAEHRVHIFMADTLVHVPAINGCFCRLTLPLYEATSAAGDGTAPDRSDQ